MEKEELSERLSGICQAATIRAAQLLAIHLNERITPAAMDELRSTIELAVRAAALEGARAHHSTSFTLIEGRLTAPGFLMRKTRAVNRPKSGLPNGV